MFALSSGACSWFLSLQTLLALSLPLLIFFIVILVSSSHTQTRTWLLPVLAGCLISSLYTASYTDSRLGSEIHGQNIDLEGVISGLPVIMGGGARFDFDVSQWTLNKSPGKVRLNWHEAPELKAGETWRLTVRLRQPHGFSSPGAFDFEAWLIRQGIQATGYVKSGELVDERASWQYRIHHLREHLKVWLSSVASEQNKGLFIGSFTR